MPEDAPFRPVHPPHTRRAPLCAHPALSLESDRTTVPASSRVDIFVCGNAAVSLMQPLTRLIYVRGRDGTHFAFS